MRHVKNIEKNNCLLGQRANYQNMTRQGEDTFVGIIFMSGAKKWSNVVSNVDELVQNLAVGTIYVASPDQADLFPQTTYKF